MDTTKRLKELEEKLNNFKPSKKNDVFALEAVKEALKAARTGTFGVGAILVHNETNAIMYRGQNKVFSESRSDLHAEMDVLNTFEVDNKDKSRARIKEFTMFTSLESCPMCLCRLITSGIMEVYHIADDGHGGMVHLFGSLPPAWQEIAKGRTYKKAECSDELSEISEQIFLLTVDLDKKLAKNDVTEIEDKKNMVAN
jgi:cytosine deaminase